MFYRTLADVPVVGQHLMYRIYGTHGLWCCYVECFLLPQLYASYDPYHCQRSTLLIGRDLHTVEVTCIWFLLRGFQLIGLLFEITFFLAVY